MAITYKTTGSGSHALAFTDASPWDDVPLARVALSLAVDRKLPPPVDWSVSPGSDEGLAAYESYLRLWTRWVDEEPETSPAMAALLNGDLHLPVADALQELIAALRERAADYPAETAHAHGLFGLASLGTALRWVTRVTPRRQPGPIRELTAQFEGFDRFNRVSVADDGQLLAIEYLSGSRYRIQAGDLRDWMNAGNAGHIARARKSAKSRAVLVTFESGEQHELSALSLLRRCEPLYRPG